MNVLLGCPTFPEMFCSFFHAPPFIGKKAAFPPLFPGRANAFGDAIPNRNEKTRIHPNVPFMNSGGK